MTGKGIGGLCCSQNTFPSSAKNSSSQPTDRILAMAQAMIIKWNPETTDFGRLTSLFYQNRGDARDFVKTVNDLQAAMHLWLADDSSSDLLVRAHDLMRIAMDRLQKEFYQILSMRRAVLDPESVSTRASAGSSAAEYDEDEDEIRVAISDVKDTSTDLAMEDLRLIAECMISSGYAKECVKMYALIRKSIVDEGIYRLGVEKLHPSKTHRMDWQVLELRIQKWLYAVGTAVKTLFNGERILCDFVFASSDPIRESCFTEITREGTTILFGFPDIVARNNKRSPEKVFRLLDMYACISNHLPEIESIFSFPSTLAVKSQVKTSLAKLGELVRAALHDFESIIRKEHSTSPIPGGGIHPLTTDAMNYLLMLADYSSILSDITTDATPPPAEHSLPESYTDASPVSLKLAWFIVVLRCKLDTKAEYYYKDVHLAYLFLANNLQHIVGKVRASNLRNLLGDQWLALHESKVQQFASTYERLGWSDVIDSLPADPTAANIPEKVREILQKFNTAFDVAYGKQSVCVVPDRKLRDDIKRSITGKIIPHYREFLSAHRRTIARGRDSASLVRYVPEHVDHLLSDLFFEAGSFSSFNMPASNSKTLLSCLRSKK